MTMEQKEYRIISAGEDGNIAIWAFNFNDDKLQYENFIETEIVPTKIDEIKP